MSSFTHRDVDSHPEMTALIMPDTQWGWLLWALIDDSGKLAIIGRYRVSILFSASASESGRSIDEQREALVSTLAIRERYRDDYWQKHDPIADDRLLWRAQTFRHTSISCRGRPFWNLVVGNSD